MARSLLAAASLLLALAAQAAPVRTEHVEAELLAEAAAAVPGKPATVAITTGELRGHGLRHERFKYIRNVRWGTEQLYDLERDPLERDTVAAAHPVRVAYYRQELFRRVFRSLSAPARAAGPAKLSPEQLENLRSLGYVN